MAYPRAGKHYPGSVGEFQAWFRTDADCLDYLEWLRWAADSTHMSHYLNEFVFRFNRRRSRSRGMVFYRVLELAVAHEPMRFQDLIASRRPRKLPPEPPKRRGHPTSLERPGANRPWRSAAEH